jgi:hypothetical protein
MFNLLKKPTDIYGSLPTHLPLSLLEEMPRDADTSLVEPYVNLIWRSIPEPLRTELNLIAEQVGSRSAALLWNLHYEVFGGACVSAVLPSDEGYMFYRRLEWDVGFTPEFRFEPLNSKSAVRYTPGFVGALSGYNQHFHIAMNAEPEMGVPDTTAYPVAWHMRKVLASNCTLNKAMNYLLRQRVARGAFVILADHECAVWLHLGGGYDNQIMAYKIYPESLIVGNIYEEKEMDECGWKDRGAGPFKADDPKDWVLDQYIIKAVVG